MSHDTFTEYNYQHSKNLYIHLDCIIIISINIIIIIIWWNVALNF